MADASEFLTLEEVLELHRVQLEQQLAGLLRQLADV
jgi:hypothetical protein